MPWGWSFFKHTANANLKPGQDVQTSSEISYRPNDGWSVSSEIEVNLTNVGADLRTETVKFQAENDTGSVTVAGPSAGAEVGFKLNQNGARISAMAELSAARAEGTLKVTENAAVYGSANLNANTGAKIGFDGVEVNVLGLGLTLGVGGKWTFNTPFGSIGACSVIANKITHGNRERTRENADTN